MPLARVLLADVAFLLSISAVTITAASSQGWGAKRGAARAFLPEQRIARGGADFFDEGLSSDGGGSGDNNGRANVEIRPPQGMMEDHQAQHQYQQQYQQQQPSYQQRWETTQDQGYQQVDSHCNYSSGQNSMVSSRGNYGQMSDPIAELAAYIGEVAASSRMDVRTVSLALRYTCEINRRLRNGTTGRLSGFKGSSKTFQHLHQELIGEDDEDWPSQMSEQSLGQQQHGYENDPSHPSQAWNPGIQRADPDAHQRESQSSLTIFHAQNPRTSSKPRTGVRHWGPDLHQYLENLCDCLGCTEDPLVLAHALLYLDRASSVETERQVYQGYTSNIPRPCPPLLPRTVHRLLLTAIVLSFRASRGLSGEENDGCYYEQLAQFGVSQDSLAAMERAMRDSLGLEGFYVDENRLIKYLLAWAQTFKALPEKEDPTPIIPIDGIDKECLAASDTNQSSTP